MYRRVSKSRSTNRVGSRAQVMHGNAKMTGGGLKKKDLKYNKQGKIVSKKMSSMAKKEKRLQKAGWVTKKGQFGAVRSMRGGRKRIFKCKILSKSEKWNDVEITIDTIEKTINIEREVYNISEISLYRGQELGKQSRVDIKSKSDELLHKLDFNSSTDIMQFYQLVVHPPISSYI